MRRAGIAGLAQIILLRTLATTGPPRQDTAYGVGRVGFLSAWPGRLLTKSQQS